MPKSHNKPMGLKKIGIIIYTIIMVIYGIYNMVVAIQAYLDFQDTVNDYNLLVDNLKQKPITDVTYTTATQTTTGCASGYEPLVNNTFPGTEQGCDCVGHSSSSKGVSSKIYVGSCSSNQTKAGCGKIDAIKSGGLYNLNLDGQDHALICIKRDYSAYYESAPVEDTDCSGKKQCGSSGTPVSVYCVKEGEDCPIYSMEFSTTSDATYTSANYEEITLGSSTQALYISRGTSASEPPISEIRWTQGPGVCQNNTQGNLASGQDESVLLKTSRKHCTDTDPRFIEFTKNSATQQTDSEYYGANYYDKTSTSYYTKLTTDLPDFEVSSSEWKGYKRTFISWKIENREDMKTFVEKQDTISNMSTAQLAVMIINILVCILVSICLTISQVYNLLGKDVPCIPGDGEEEATLIKKIKKYINLGAKILQLPFLIWALALSSSNKSFFADIAGKSVSDNRSNDEVSEVSDLIQTTVFTKNVTMIITFAIVILIDIALFIKAKYFTKKKDDQGAIKPATDEENGSPVKQNNNLQNNKETPAGQNGESFHNQSSQNKMIPLRQFQSSNAPDEQVHDPNAPNQNNIMQPPE